MRRALSLSERKNHDVVLPLLAGLFLEINALVIALMIAAFLAHQVIALCDVRYAVTRRYVSPIEQHVHSFLEMIVVVLNWPQFLALFGLDNESPRCCHGKRNLCPCSISIW